MEAGAQGFNAGKITSFLMNNGNVDKKLEASAVAILDGGEYMIVADDKAGGLLIVEIKTGREIHTIENSQLTGAVGDIKSRVKWEAIARDPEYFYVVASHSSDWRFYLSNSFLIRFSLSNPDDGFPLKLNNVIRWHIGDALEKLELYPPPPNKKDVEYLKIEGLAVWYEEGQNKETRQKMAIGLRKAKTLVPPVRIYVADITGPPKNDDQLELTELFSFEAGDIDSPFHEIQ